MTLNELTAGDSGRIEGYEATARDYRKKLLALGLTPGTELAVVRHAPLGDPIEIAVRGSLLTLRRSEASGIRIAKT